MQLSGGQRQRIAIARALLDRPAHPHHGRLDLVGGHRDRGRAARRARRRSWRDAHHVRRRAAALDRAPRRPHPARSTTGGSRPSARTTSCSPTSCLYAEIAASQLVGGEELEVAPARACDAGDAGVRRRERAGRIAGARSRAASSHRRRTRARAARARAGREERPQRRGRRCAGCSATSRRTGAGSRVGAGVGAGLLGRERRGAGADRARRRHGARRAAATSRPLTPPMLALLGAYLVGWFAQRQQILALGTVGQRALVGVRAEVFDKVLDAVGRVLRPHRVRRPDEPARQRRRHAQLASSRTRSAASSAPRSASSRPSIGMFLADWRLALATLAIVPLLWLTTTRVLARRPRARTAARGRRSATSRPSLAEELAGIRVSPGVRAHRREPRERSTRATPRTATRTSRRRRSSAAFRRRSASSPPLAIAHRRRRSAGCSRREGLVTIGVVVAFFAYARQFFNAVNQLSSLYADTQSALAGGERIFAPARHAGGGRRAPGRRGPARMSRAGRRSRACGSRYADGPEVLHGIDLDVEPGHDRSRSSARRARASRRSSTCSRASTTRPPGAVRVDGHDLRDVHAARRCRRRLGVVLQEPFLFAGTIADNIRYGRLDATRRRGARRRRELARAREFIERLPEGFDTSVGERGALLSTGQRQLVAFARAILADPAILHPRRGDLLGRHAHRGAHPGRRCAASSPAARPSSSRTGSRPCATPTASSSSRTAASSRSGDVRRAARRRRRVRAPARARSSPASPAVSVPNQRRDRPSSGTPRPHRAAVETSLRPFYLRSSSATLDRASCCLLYVLVLYSSCPISPIGARDGARARHTRVPRAAEPMTGYDLKTRCFDDAAGHLWTADQAQVYRTLDTLGVAWARQLAARATTRQTRPPPLLDHRAGPCGPPAWLRRRPRPASQVRDPFLLHLLSRARPPRRRDRVACSDARATSTSAGSTDLRGPRATSSTRGRHETGRARDAELRRMTLDGGPRLPRERHRLDRRLHRTGARAGLPAPLARTDRPGHPRRGGSASDETRGAGCERGRRRTGHHGRSSARPARRGTCGVEVTRIRLYDAVQLTAAPRAATAAATSRCTRRHRAIEDAAPAARPGPTCCSSACRRAPSQRDPRARGAPATPRRLLRRGVRQPPRRGGCPRRTRRASAPHSSLRRRPFWGALPHLGRLPTASPACGSVLDRAGVEVVATAAVRPRWSGPSAWD